MDAAAWRCPVCEGVNHGGRTCATCGERLPDGFVPRDATLLPAPRVVPRVVPGGRRPAPRRPEPRSFEDVFGSPPAEPDPWF